MARKASAQVDPKTPEPEQVAIITEPVEIDVSETDEQVSDTVAAPEVESPPQPSLPVVEDQEKIELRERVREVEEAERQARQAAEQANREKQQSQRQVHDAQYDSVVNTLGAAQAQLEAAKTELRNAQRLVRDGNSEMEDQIPDLIERVSGANWEVKRWETAKQQWDNWYEQQKRQAQQPRQQQPQQPQQQRQPTVEEIISEAKIPDRAKAWLRQHPDYITDQAKNTRLQVLHEVAMRESGEQFTDSYFDRMEVLLGMKQQQSGQTNGATQPSQTQQRQSAPVSAPPTRETPSMATGRAPQPTKVTLSAEEREVASSMVGSRFPTQAEAEREYARQKLRLQREKAEGKLSN